MVAGNAGRSRLQHVLFCLLLCYRDAKSNAVQVKDLVEPYRVCVL